MLWSMVLGSISRPSLPGVGPGVAPPVVEAPARAPASPPVDVKGPIPRHGPLLAPAPAAPAVDLARLVADAPAASRDLGRLDAAASFTSRPAAPWTASAGAAEVALFGWGRGQRRLDGALAGLRRSALFRTMEAGHEGELRIRDLRDSSFEHPEYGRIEINRRASYDPATRRISVDVDDARDAPMAELSSAVAEEYAHDWVSQAVLGAMRGLEPGAVRNRVNEVVAKTYAQLALDQASGARIDGATVDRAVAGAFEDVDDNYGHYPQGYYGVMLDGFFGGADRPYEGTVRRALERRFAARGWPR